MKKIILTAAAVFALTFANAQDKKESSEGFSKGDVFVSGTMSITSVSNGGTSESTFMPSVGYFMSEKIAISATFGVMNGIDGVNGQKATAFGVGAAYFFNPGNQFSTNVNVGLAMANVDNNGAKVTATSLGLGYGMNYFLSSKFALTANLGVLSYTSGKPDGGDATTITSLDVDFNNVMFGLVYKF